MRYKSRLGVRVAEQKASDAKQQQLRRKYKVDAEGIIKVEKKPVMEVMIEYGGYFMKTVIMMILFILVATGVLSLTYMYIEPETPLKDILQELIIQFERLR